MSSTRRRIADLRGNLNNKEFVTYFLDKLLAQPTSLCTDEIAELLIDLITDHQVVEAKKIINSYPPSSKIYAFSKHHGKNALWAALCARQNEIVLLILKHFKKADNKKYAKESLTLQDAQNKKLLHFGVYSTEVLEELFNTFSKEEMFHLMDSIDNDWQTPLHIACNNKNIKTIIILINRGAILSTANKAGKTPLELILSFDKEDLLRVFTQLDFQMQKYFIEEILRNSDSVLSTPQLRANYMQALNCFQQAYPHITDLLINQPDTCDRVSAKIAILDLLYSERQFEALQNKFQENKNYISQLPANNLGFRILAILVNFLIACALVGFVAPFSLVTRTYANLEKYYKHLYDVGRAEVAAGNITQSEWWQIQDVYWEKKYDLENKISSSLTGVILPAIFLGALFLVSCFVIIPAWMKKAKYKPENVIQFYDELDVILKGVRAATDKIDGYHTINLSQFQNDNTARDIWHHQSHIQDLSSEVESVRAECFRKRFALFKMPRVIVEQPQAEQSNARLLG